MGKVELGSTGQACIIHSKDARITEGLLSEVSQEFVARTVPSGSMIPSSRTLGTSIEIRGASGRGIREQFPNFTVYGEVNSKDAIALGDYLLERRRQEAGIYNLHASAVARGETCTVIHGASKSGKTVIPLELMRRGGVRYLVNERTLIDLEDAALVGGCERVALSGYHKEMFPGLIEADAISLGDFTRPRYAINKVIYPNIDSGQKSIIVEEWGSEKAEWLLYPELSSKIRGTNKRMFDFTRPLDSIDTRELAERRIGALKIFLDKTPFYFVKGTLEGICDFIDAGL